VSPLAGYVELTVLMTGAALVVGLFAERLGIPYSVALLVVGIAASPLASTAPLFTFPQGLLFVFLPALVFEAALHLDTQALLRRWMPIATLAIPGVLFTALCIAFACSSFAGLAFGAAFVLGAIVSATDPVAVIATFKRLTVPLDLQTIVEAEAVANDGIAVVLYSAAITLVGTGHVDWLHEAGAAVYEVTVGIAIGVVLAYVYVRLLAGMKDAGYYSVGSLVLAYGSYLLANHVGASGIFASVAAGIAIGLFKRYAPPEEIAREVESFWSVLAFLANSLVFLFMGFALNLERLFGEPLVIAVALLVVFLTRAVLAYGVLPWFGIVRSWQHVVAWSGLRGGLALALALNLPNNLIGREAIVHGTFVVVLVTLVLEGLTIEPLLRRLKLS